MPSDDAGGIEPPRLASTDAGDFFLDDTYQGFIKWVFPKIGVPQNGWFMMENLIEMDDLGVPLFLETHKWDPFRVNQTIQIYGNLQAFRHITMHCSGLVMTHDP